MASNQGRETLKKPRKAAVKPIFRRLTQSEKNSLDLDRPAAEQDGLGIYGPDYRTGSLSSHDVQFNHTTRRGYHNRSTSGTSQFSTATAGSGHRAGSFVHPFQQTPRPYTPPLQASYQGSLRESEHSSPALTEDEDQLRHNFRSNSTLSANRTSSLSGTSPAVQPPPPLHALQTKLPSSSRLALATSHSSLHNTLAFSPDFASPSPLDTTMSPLRTSLDKGAFRLRSRSEVEPRPHSETIQEARRRFEAKERAKDEKAAMEEQRAQEKRNQKEARRHRASSASNHRPPWPVARSRSDLTVQEKDGALVGREYTSVPERQEMMVTGEDSFGAPGRRNTAHSAKKKSHGAWTKFMMWLRTRFIRLGKRRERA